MENFSDRLVTILNHGALNLALGIGYSNGIFDTMDEHKRSLSPELEI